MSRNAARLAIELGDRLYTLDRPITGIEELLDWDLGLGPDHPDYVDVVLPTEAHDPFDVNIALTLAENIDNLGLDQIGAPEVVTWDLEENET